MSETAPVIPGEVAGLGRRLAALAVDWLVSIGVSLLLFRDIAYGSLESSVAILLIFAAELILLTWLTGASFGQRILGIQVVNICQTFGAPRAPEMGRFKCGRGGRIAGARMT